MCLPIQEVKQTGIWSLGQEGPLEKQTAAHSSILAWEIPWTEEPGRLWPPWRHKESDTTEHTHTHIHTHVTSIFIILETLVYQIILRNWNKTFQTAKTTTNNNNKNTTLPKLNGLDLALSDSQGRPHWFFFWPVGFEDLFLFIAIL